jgi:DNA-binding MarR family transcriptional regulator
MRDASLKLAPHADPPNARALSNRVKRILRSVGGAREDHGLNAEEVLIYLALGQMGQRSASGAVAITPVTCLKISELLKIPKETVRRKAARLVEQGLAAQTSRGLLIKNIDEWRRLAEAIAT